MERKNETGGEASAGEPALAKLEVSKASFVWHVKIYRYITGDSVRGYISDQPSFASQDNSVRWRLGLSPDALNRRYASVWLSLEQGEPRDMQALCSLAASRWRLQPVKCPLKWATAHECMDETRRLEFPRFLSLDDDFGESDVLYVHCEVFAYARPAAARGLSRDLGALMASQKLVDVVLVASGKQLPAHKAVLVARSPVFASMFEHEMREKRRNVVDIPDVRPEVLQQLLRYVYTDRLEQPERDTAELLAAADKYQLDELKDKCEKALARRLTVANAVNTLVLADRHNAASLKSRTIEFMNENASQLVRTPAFKALGQAQAHLVVEAYCLLAPASNDELGPGRAAKPGPRANPTRVSKRRCLRKFRQ